jgi:PKD repeat protein
MAKGFLTSTPSALTAATTTGWGADKFLNNAANGDAARVNVFSNTKRDWLISPSINLGATAGNYVLEFNLGVIAYSATTTVTNPTGTTLGSDDTVAVVISTNNGATWSTADAVRVWTATNTPISSTGSQRYYIPLNNLSGQIKIGFYAGEGTVNDAPDNDIFIDSVLLTTCTKPVVNAGNDTVICSNASVTLNAGTGAAAYQWTNSGSIAVISSTATHTTSTAGTYIVQGSTSNPGCFSTDTVTVTTTPAPVVNLGNDTAFCSGNSTVLNAANAGSSYLWSTGATTQTITANASGSYNVRVTNTSGCIGRDTVVVTVNPLPVVNLGNDTSFCAPASISLNAGNQGASYLWSTGAITQTIAASASGSYNVRVTNANNCIGRDTINITVRPKPVAGSINVTGSSPSFTFGSTGTQTSMFRIWNFGDNSTPDSVSISPTHTYTQNGTYTVKLIVQDSCGTDSATTTVEVSGLAVGGVVAGADVRLFPNPANTIVWVENMSNQKMGVITILNAVGAVVAEKTASGTREQIDLSSLPAGSYLVRIQMDGNTTVRRLQITK